MADPAPTALTHEQAVAHLTTTDPQFHLTTAEIRGQTYTVFANAPKHVRGLLEHSAETYGDRDILVYENDRWTYPEFRRDVARLSNVMRFDLGLRQGDRVGVAMRNYPEILILIFAAAAAGIVVVPLNAWWTGPELVQGLDNCAVTHVFADGERADRIRAADPQGRLHLIGVRNADTGAAYTALRDAADDTWPEIDIDPDADFAILFSSGSTSFPKGVVQTHRNVISAVWSWMTLKTMAPMLLDEPVAPSPYDPSFLIISPLFHVTALQANVMLGIAAGAKISLMYKWDVDDAIRIIGAEKITRVNGVPTQTADLSEAAIRRGLDFDHLTDVGGGGAARPAAQVHGIARAFVNAAPGIGWGMTETNALGVTLSGPDYLSYPNAIGRLTPPVQQMRIVDDDGAPVATGDIGELQIRGPNIMRGYLDQPEATAEVLRDGWLSTGDLARIGDGGMIYLVDRKKVIVIRGGENISCSEIETILHDHPAVLEACVFAVPHNRLGETVGAMIYPGPDKSLTSDEVAAFLHARLAAFKHPEQVWIADAPLTRGATDKIDRKAIRAACLNRPELANHP